MSDVAPYEPGTPDVPEPDAAAPVSHEPVPTVVQERWDELRDVVGAVTPLALAAVAFGAQQAAAHIGIERRRRDAQSLCRFLGTQPFGCHS